MNVYYSFLGPMAEGESLAPYVPSHGPWQPSEGTGIGSPTPTPVPDPTPTPTPTPDPSGDVAQATFEIREVGRIMALAGSRFWTASGRPAVSDADIVPAHLASIPRTDGRYASAQSWAYYDTGDRGLYQLSIMSEEVCSALNTSVDNAFKGTVIRGSGAERSVEEGCYHHAGYGFIYVKWYPNPSTPTPDPTPTPTPTPVIVPSEGVTAGAISLHQIGEQVGAAAGRFWFASNRPAQSDGDLVPAYLDSMPRADPAVATAEGWAYYSVGDRGLYQLSVKSREDCISVNNIVDVGYKGRVIPGGEERSVDEGCFDGGGYGLIYAKWYRKGDTGESGIAPPSEAGGHRFWRVRADGPSVDGSDVFSLNEVQMRSVVGGDDVTVRGTPIASGFLGGNPGYDFRHAFDNQLLGSFWASPQVRTSWIGYDFGTNASRALKEIVLFNRADGYYNQMFTSFVIEHSDDGLTWVGRGRYDNLSWTPSNGAQGSGRAFLVDVDPTTPEAISSGNAARLIRDVGFVVTQAGAKFWSASGMAPVGDANLVPAHLAEMPRARPGDASSFAESYYTAGDRAAYQLLVSSEGTCVAINSQSNNGFRGMVMQPSAQLGVAEGCYAHPTLGFVYLKWYDKGSVLSEGVPPCTTSGPVRSTFSIDADGVRGVYMPSRLCRSDQLVSPDGRFMLSMQTDGNLVLYYVPENRAVWQTGTNGQDAVMQADGNFVVSAANGSSVWSSGTAGNPGARLRLTDDGGFRILDAAEQRVLWDAHTDICTVVPVGSPGPALGGANTTLLPRRLCVNQYVPSPGDRFRLTQLPNGSLGIVQASDGAAIWNSDSPGANYKLEMRPDGNVALIRRDGNAVWTTGTNGQVGSHAVFNENGNFAVYSADYSRILFETRSDRCLPRAVGVGSGNDEFGTAGTLAPDTICAGEYVDSPDGRFRLQLRPDGNLVLLAGAGFAEVIWQSATADRDVYKLVIGSDGAWRLFRRDGREQWSFGTGGNPGSRLMVQSDGNLTIHDAGFTRLLWQSRTDRCLPREAGVGVGRDSYGTPGTYLPLKLCIGETVQSPNGRFRMGIAEDGQIRLATGQGFTDSYWGNGAGGSYRLLRQTDGDWVTLLRNGGVNWRTGTGGNPGSRMMMLDDGNIVVYSSDGRRQLWHSGTERCEVRNYSAGIGRDLFGTLGTRLPEKLCFNGSVDSPNGLFRLQLQTDGNLALYTGADMSEAIWSTQTAGSASTKLVHAADGAWHLLRSNDSLVWASPTGGNPGSFMMVQDDGNVTVHTADGSRLLWETRSDRCLARNVASGTRADLFGTLGSIVPVKICMNTYVDSPNGLFRLTMRSDGDLALTTGPDLSETVWRAGTSGSGTYRLLRFGDGDYVMENRNGTPIWRTGTGGNAEAVMMVQDDGNVTVHDKAFSRVLWETRSDRCVPGPVGSGTVTDEYGVAGTIVPQKICMNRYVTSPNGRFRLNMQADGDLTVTTGFDFSERIWSAGTSGRGTYRLLRFGDGDYVMENRAGTPIWRTGTGGNPGSRMTMNDDGNVVVRTDNGVRFLWESSSYRCLPRSSGGPATATPSGVQGSLVPRRMCLGEFVDSPDGRFRLNLQDDGNMVLYEGPTFSTPIWQAGTAGYNVGQLIGQGDGDFVLYRRAGGPVWRTGTGGNVGARMFVQSDGNVAIYRADGAMIWDTRTGGRTATADVAGAALRIRQSGQRARDGLVGRIAVPESLADLGMADYDYGSGARFWGFDKVANGLQYVVTVESEEVCSAINVQTGGVGFGGYDAGTRPEGCGRDMGGTMYYWRSLEDVQASSQASFMRSFGIAVRSAAASYRDLPSSLDQLGMAAAQRYNLLTGSGFEDAGRSRVFWAQVTSASACISLDASVGNGSRGISTTSGYSPAQFAEGCGGYFGSYYYWRKVDDAFAGNLATTTRGVVDGALRASAAAGGSMTQAGRDAAAGFLDAGIQGRDLFTSSGVYLEGPEYFAQIAVASASVCARLDQTAGNGVRDIDAGYDPQMRLEGCGLTNGRYWYWQRLDRAAPVGAVFDPFPTFTASANSDPIGRFRYLGGIDLMQGVGPCEGGVCVTGDQPSLRVYKGDGQPTLRLHPGVSKEARVRFVAPTAGIYRVVGRFGLIDVQQATGVDVNWGKGAVRLTAASSERAFDYRLEMLQGQSLDLTVDAAGSADFDTTGMALAITYQGTSGQIAQANASYSPQAEFASPSRFAFSSTAGDSVGVDPDGRRRLGGQSGWMHGIDGGAYFMTPGSEQGQRTILRFVAPRTASFSFNGQVRADASCGDGFTFKVADEDPVQMYGSSLPIGFTRAMTEGQVVDFVMDGGASQTCDRAVVGLTVR